MKYSILALIAALMVCGSVQANLISNGTFEVDLAGWTAHNGAITRVEDNGPSAPGSWAMQTAPAAEIAGGNIAASAGVEYTFKFDSKQILDSTKDNGVFFHFQQWDGLTGDQGVNHLGNNGWHFARNLTNDWQTTTFVFTPVANTAYIVPVFGVYDGQATGNVLFDNVSLVPEPATLAILGLGTLLGLRKRK